MTSAWIRNSSLRSSAGILVNPALSRMAGLLLLVFSLGCSGNAPERYANIRSLASREANSLVPNQGLLDLDGLNELDAESAKILVEKSNLLYLNGLAEVDDEVADVLSQAKGKIYLEGLTSLRHRGLAEKIASLPGGVFLKSLKLLGADAARGLSFHEGDLALPSLDELEEGVAEALSIHKGRLWLNNIKRLSDGDAKALLKHDGIVFLNSLEDTSSVGGLVLRKMKKKGFIIPDR